MLYAGIFDQTNEARASGRPSVPAACTYDANLGYYCYLTGGGQIYKDAGTKLRELTEDFSLMIEEVNTVKTDFSELIADVQGQKQGIEDLLERLSFLENDYDDANACVGLPTSVGSLWSFASSPQTILYSSIAGVAAAGLAATATFLAGGVIATGGILIVGAPIAFAVGYFISRRAKKKAKRKLRKKQAAIASECREGVKSFNRNLGQLADTFLCGRTNPQYKEPAPTTLP